jgi:FKBP-type peptidyl-prolyl cis-trans isomerase FklB
MRRTQIPVWVIAGCALLAMSAAGSAEEGKLDFQDETTRINYSLGYQIGGDFKKQGVEIDAEAVTQGIKDALAGGEPQMPRDEMHATLVALKQKVDADLRARRVENELAYVREGEAFLADNAAKEGVQVANTGLQYRIVEPGSGRRPTATDTVTVNYRGTLVNGNEFDSGRGVSFPLNGVIKGWTEGLQLVGEGGKIQLFIPPSLAYGDRGPLAHRTLIFDVELLSIGDAGAK